MRAIDLTLREIVTTDDFTSVMEAAKLMRQHGAGDIVITRGAGRAMQPIGVITDRDITVHAAELLNNLTAMVTRQIGYEQEHILRAKSHECAA